MPVLTKINTNSIAEDAITGDKFAGDAYLSNTANQNISGTYSENRLYTSDAYTLSANATVNSHLTLSSIKDSGDVVLTAGGAYTLTGTGTLSGGSMYGRQTLTGMTGELGSTVTQVSGYTLGSGVTFPAGHVINYWSQTRSSGTAVLHHNITTTFTKIDFGGNFDIAGVTATQNNKLRLTMANMNWHAVDDNTYATSLMVTTDGVTGASGNILGHWSGYMNDAGSHYLPLTFIWEYTVPASFTNKTLSVVTRKQTGAPGGSWQWNTSQNANHGGDALSTVLFSVEEIQV